MNKKTLFITLFTIGFGFLCDAAISPPPSGNTPPSGGSPTCWPPPCIPIDGGISLLIAAGAIYGGKKLFVNLKEKNT
ncbi:MAG: hypothetical protein V4580_08460 [Bacteroidota bacterium]